MTYAEKLQDPRWQKKRLEILERDSWTCKLCGDKDTTLHIHHKKYSPNPWDAEDSDLISYCKHCHSIIEYNKNQEKIIPYCVIKYELDNKIKLILLYNDEEKENYIDFYYYYPSNKLEYLTSISAVSVGRINHFFKTLNDF